MFFLLMISYSGIAQNIQLHYSGTNQKIIKAISEANKILSNEEFYKRIESIQKFDNTSYTGQQIVKEMKAIKTIEVTEYYKKHTKTNAKTQTEICMNTAKLDRYSDELKNLASLVNTLIHESVHAVDWLTNKHWDYTHKGQKEEIPPISAPYIIGAIAESMVN